MELDPKVNQMFVAVAQWAVLYTAPIFFVDPKTAENPKVHANASCFFVNTGERMFAVTCKHVIEGFRELKKEKSDAEFLLGSIPLDIEIRLIAEGDKRDIATMQIENEDLHTLGKRCCDCTSWPPPDAKNNETVVFAGYPQIYRGEPRTGEIRIESVPIIETVHDSSPRHFSIGLSGEDWVKLIGYRELSELTKFAGFSGGPVFRLKDTEIVVLEPIGVIYQYNSYGIIHALHIGFINADGTII